MNAMNNQKQATKNLEKCDPKETSAHTVTIQAPSHTYKDYSIIHIHFKLENLNLRLITCHLLPITHVMNYNLKHLEELEAESIYVLREVAAQFENPVLLFSGGKDSIVMSYLAKKAFAPGKIPFPMMHVDT